MYNKKAQIIKTLSNIGYIIGCLILYLISISILLSTFWTITQDVLSHSFTVYLLLDEAGLIVFAIGVIDVAKYLMLEGVIRVKEEQSPRELRKALTKFTMIIATALSLEGLVLTIETSKTDITQVLYPVCILFASILFIIGIGIYQRLNAMSEKN